MPIIDASPAVCSDLFHVGSCGWSDRFKIVAVPSGEEVFSDLGPYKVTPEELQKIIEVGERILNTTTPKTC